MNLCVLLVIGTSLIFRPGEHDKIRPEKPDSRILMLKCMKIWNERKPGWVNEYRKTCNNSYYYPQFPKNRGQND